MDNHKPKTNEVMEMAKNRTCTDAPEFNNHPILTDKDRGLRCAKKILQAIDTAFNHFFDNHDRGFFMRYDVRAPDGYDDPSNDAYRSGQANFIKNLSRQGLDPHYVAVREQKSAENPHYHGILLVDGRETQSIHDHIIKATDSFASAFGVPQNKGLVDDCTKDKYGHKQPNGVMLRKDDPEFECKLDGCIQRASYLAKVNQKEKTPRKVRELFSTRINKPKDNGKSDVQDKQHGGGQSDTEDVRD